MNRRCGNVCEALVYIQISLSLSSERNGTSAACRAETRVDRAAIEATTSCLGCLCDLVGGHTTPHTYGTFL